MLGNWYFISGMTLIFLPVIWYVTDKIIEPRLDQLMPSNGASETAGIVKSPNSKLQENEVNGLKYSGVALISVIALWTLLCIAPGTPLIDGDEVGIAKYNPLLQSVVAGFFIVFLAMGWAYGHGAGTIKNHRDVVQMMSESMSDLAYYLVLAFTAAHFVAMFAWSNLGLIFAINGASFLQSSNLPDAILLSLIIVFGAIINLFIGSASAKWALLAPVLVPMLMLLGISPEMSTAAYRVGDGATNIITPLMPYFPLILIFCQRWQKEFGIGSLAATMLPYSISLLFAGLVMTVIWVILALPLGPNAPFDFSL